MFGPLNVFRSLPEASSTHSATAQQSPQGSSMKGLCAVVGIGTTAVLHSVLIIVFANNPVNSALSLSNHIVIILIHPKDYTIINKPTQTIYYN